MLELPERETCSCMVERAGMVSQKREWNLLLQDRQKGVGDEGRMVQRHEQHKQWPR